MALQLGDTAPDFTAETTVGTLHFHQWIENAWAILFSHPKDFTPVCTTELGYMAHLQPAFTQRHCKIIGLSVDSLDAHRQWAQDIAETQGYAPNYPLIADPERRIASLYGMIHPNANDTMTVRSVFVIGPDKKIKLMLISGQHRAELRRNPAHPGLAATHRRPPGGHPRELAAGRGRHHCTGLVRRGSATAVSGRLEDPKALPTCGTAATLADESVRHGPGASG